MLRSQDMPITLERSGRASEKNDGERIVVVLVPVAHAASIENHRMVEERAIAIGCRRELVDEIGEHRYVILVDQREIVHVRFRVRVVRSAMEGAAVAALRVSRRA